MRLDSAKADRITAVVLLATGIALLWAGWSMDRLEVRRIHPASIPGLLPMLLGGTLVVVAALLGLTARDPETPAPTGSARDLGLAAALCGLYALAMVGTLPFAPATALFVGAFVALFDRDRPPLRRLILGAAFGVAVAAAISLLFRYAFLVRLP
jgi:putative tricarboxylic transport membrane protein